MEFKDRKSFMEKISKLGVDARLKKQQKEEQDLHFRIENSKEQSALLLSRLCGFLIGDGSVFIRKSKKSDGKHYDIRFYPDDESVADLFMNTFYEVYHKKSRIKKEEKYFLIGVESKTACNHLLSIIPFASLSWKVPHALLINQECKKEFVRAFFDCEAYVGRRMIQVQSVNKEGLKQIMGLLKEFEIESKLYEYHRKNKNWNTNYILCIMKKDSRERYLNNIGFNHLSKQKKLENMPR